MICKACGYNCPDGAAFCPACGTAQVPEAGDTQPLSMADNPAQQAPSAPFAPSAGQGYPYNAPQQPYQGNPNTSYYGAPQNPYYNVPQQPQYGYAPQPKKSKTTLFVILGIVVALIITGVVLFITLGGDNDSGGSNGDNSFLGGNGGVKDNSLPGTWACNADLAPLMKKSIMGSMGTSEAFECDPIRMSITIKFEKDGTCSMSFDKNTLQNDLYKFADKLGAYMEAQMGVSGIADRLKTEMNVDNMFGTDEFEKNGTYKEEDGIITMTSADGDETKLKRDGNKLVAVDDDGNEIEDMGFRLEFTKN